MSYHPTLGRFIQRDPMGYVDGRSLYEYVTSNPALRRDSSGKQALLNYGSTARPNAAKKCDCGPDMTFALMNMMDDIDQQFRSLSPTQRDSLCSGYINQGHWDSDLYSSPGMFGIPRSSWDTRGPGIEGGPCITVVGTPHAAFDVNYIVLGRMSSLCGFVNSVIADFWFSVYKSQHSWERYFAAKDWMEFGR